MELYFVETPTKSRAAIAKSITRVIGGGHEKYRFPGPPLTILT